MKGAWEVTIGLHHVRQCARVAASRHCRWGRAKIFSVLHRCLPLSGVAESGAARIGGNDFHPSVGGSICGTTVQMYANCGQSAGM